MNAGADPRRYQSGVKSFAMCPRSARATNNPLGLIPKIPPPADLAIKPRSEMTEEEKKIEEGAAEAGADTNQESAGESAQEGAED